MTASALPEIILTPAEEDTPDVSFHTKQDFSDRGGSGSSLRRRPNLTLDSSNPGLDSVYDTGYGGGLGRGLYSRVSAICIPVTSTVLRSLVVNL